MAPTLEKDSMALRAVARMLVDIHQATALQKATMKRLMTRMGLRPAVVMRRAVSTQAGISIWRGGRQGVGKLPRLAEQRCMHHGRS